MPNMSYCRFQNTLSDLCDCENHLDEFDNLSDTERIAAEELIRHCIAIVDDYGELVTPEWGDEQETD